MVNFWRIINQRLVALDTEVLSLLKNKKEKKKKTVAMHWHKNKQPKPIWFRLRNEKKQNSSHVTALIAIEDEVNKYKKAKKW